jgi:hypothetical protein
VRLSEPTVNMFLGEIKKIEPLRERVAKAAARWMDVKKAREDPYRYVTNYDVAYAREDLAKALMDLRNVLSGIYDYMNERGLVDYESSIVAYGDQGNLDSAKARRQNGLRIV